MSDFHILWRNRVPCKQGGANKRGILSFSKESIPLKPPRERTRGLAPRPRTLADRHLKSCAACGIRCLPGVVSKRLGLLLSSLSLCLRFGSLTQFPPTLDLYRFAIACRGGFAGARRSTHYQDDMHCQMIRLHQNKMSRAAADDRSSGKSYSNSKRGNAALWAVQSASIAALRAARLQWETPFFWTVTPPVFFLGKENGGRITCSARGAAPPCRLQGVYSILHNSTIMVTNRISVLPRIFQFQNYVNFDTRLSAQYVFHSAEIKSIFPCQIR